MIRLAVGAILCYWVLVLALALDKCKPANRSIGGWVVAGLPATALTIPLIWVFIICGAAGTVQFNVYSESAMNGWSTWVDICMPLFVLGVVVNAGYLLTLIWNVCAKSRRRYLAANATGFAVSILVNLAIWTNPPLA